MKTAILFFALVFYCSAVLAQAPDTTRKAPKTYTVTGDLQAFQALITALDKSEAPHTLIDALKGWIVNQIDQQLKAEAIKPEAPAAKKPKQ
jgi:hypothetical protein